MISFELPEELVEFKKERGLEPRTISKEFSLYMSETANLYKTIKSWFGVAPNADQIKRFDVTQLLGMAASLNIEHTDKGKAKIGTIGQVPKKYAMPPAILPTVVLSYDNWDQTIFDNLPNFIKNRVMESDEYKKMFPAYKPIPTPKAVATAPQPAIVGDDNDESDLPEFLRSK